MKILNIISFALGFLAEKKITGFFNSHNEEIYIKEKKHSTKFKSNYQVCNQWVDNLYKGKSILKFFEDKGWNRVAVYGCGSLTELLCNELGVHDKEETTKSVNIELFLDGIYEGERVIGNHTITSYAPENASFDNIDVIVITPISAFDNIKARLDKLETNIHIIGIDTIIYAL